MLERKNVNRATDAIVDPAASTGRFKKANTSTSWEMHDVRVVGDVVTLDSALQISYAEHVIIGKSLPINYNTYISTQQASAGTNTSLNISRAVSR